jgi:hypothetical protein
MWDWSAFVIGLLIGAALIIFLFIILYATGAFVFKYCNSSSNGTCQNCNLLSNPGDAIMNGAKAEDILFFDQEHRMYYKRQRKPGATCYPGDNQTVMIEHPQVCQFTIDGQEVEGIATEFGSNVYKVILGNREVLISSDPHCFNPQSSGVNVTRGIATLRWIPTGAA